MDRPMNGWTHQQTDTTSYRDVLSNLKMGTKSFLITVSNLSGDEEEEIQDD